MLTTLGVDLASQPATTALCVIAWAGDGAQVRALVRSAWKGTAIDDKMLVAAVRGLWSIDGDGGWGDGGRPAKVAIDAPFGWPAPFVEALVAHHELRRWPHGIDDGRQKFERRATDRFVHQHAKKLPLSVSTDRIAYPAMRCAVILGDLSQHLPPALLARDGSGLVAEAYPDAALRMWLPDLWAMSQPDSYKGSGELARKRRATIVSALRERLGRAFQLTVEQQEACVASDDTLDALVCALVARAGQLDLTVLPQAEEQHGLAAREGWIHLPKPGSLPALVSGSASGRPPG